MGQKALGKQKFLHPTHAPLSQRCVLIINRLGSEPLSQGRRSENWNQTGRFLWGHYVSHLWNLLNKTASWACSRQPQRDISSFSQWMWWHGAISKCKQCYFKLKIMQKVQKTRRYKLFLYLCLFSYSFRTQSSKQCQVFIWRGWLMV